MSLIKPSNQSPRIEECIYCGNDILYELTDEHVIPYGLNGDWTLLDASCEKCSSITTKFEFDALKALYPIIRACLNFRTRRPKKRPKTLPLIIKSNNTEKEILVPIDEYPVYLPILELPPPLFLSPGQSFNNESIRLKFKHIYGPSYQDLSGTYKDVEFIGSHINFAPELFCRMLAKIAYCFGVYVIGLDPLKNSSIKKIIMGEDREFFKWIGMWNGEQVNENTGLHAAQIKFSDKGLHAIIKLFAQFGAPEYHVFLGQIEEQYWKKSIASHSKKGNRKLKM